MKNSTYWQAELIKGLRRYDGLTELSASRLIEIELGLFLLANLLPNAPAHTLPSLLSGYDFPYQERQFWTSQQKRFLARARFLIGQFRHRTLWQDLLEKYSQVAENLRLYSITDDCTVFTEKLVSVLPNRADLYRQTLTQPIPPQSHSPNWAEVDQEYSVDINTLLGQVVFPSGLITERAKPHILPSTARSTQPIQPTKDDLIAVGRWMDGTDQKHNLTPRGWADRIEKMQLENFDEISQSFLPADHFTISGTTNMVGMLSSRKSTLMIILAVWAAKQGLRVTLIVGDVSDVLNQCDYLCRLGLSAAPLLGKSNREQHLARLHSTTVEANPLSVDASEIHRGFS